MLKKKEKKTSVSFLVLLPKTCPCYYTDSGHLQYIYKANYREGIFADLISVKMKFSRFLVFQ